jgi:hypothetical protein
VACVTLCFITPSDAKKLDTYSVCTIICCNYCLL